jgi:hypothetical protein
MSRTKEQGTLSDLIDAIESSPFQDGLLDYCLACLSLEETPADVEYTLADHVGRDNLTRQVAWSVDSLGRVDHDSSPWWAE